MKMAHTGKWLIVLCAAASLPAADKNAKFDAGKVTDYETRQTVEQVTIAATPYLNDDEAHRAFGKKLNPNDYGILPVLVVMQNDGKDAISLEDMRCELVTPGREHVAATPAQDIRYIHGAAQPKVYGGPIPGTQRVSRKKNPLNTWEIPGRAFAAKMLLPGDTASGFVYFQAPYRAGSLLYVSGLRNPRTAQDLFYFEIPLDTGKRASPAEGQFAPRTQEAGGWRRVGGQ